MNVRVHKEVQSKIRAVDFGEYTVGYRHGQYQTEREEGWYPASQGDNNGRSCRKTDNFTQKNRVDRYMRGSTKRSTNSPEKSRPFFEEEDFYDGDRDELQFEGFEDRTESNKHAQFVRSYQGWLKDTYVNGYQTARMPATLGMKKSRVSQKSARKDKGIDMKFYQMQIKQEYKQGNLFPCRPCQSLKKVKISINQDRTPPSTVRSKYKGEGELKLKLMKNFAKKEVRGEQKRKSHPNYQSVKSIPRPQSALLRNFSNPRILSIENRQLVTGTKILLL